MEVVLCVLFKFFVIWPSALHCHVASTWQCCSPALPPGTVLYCGVLQTPRSGCCLQTLAARLVSRFHVSPSRLRICAVACHVARCLLAASLLFFFFCCCFLFFSSAVAKKWSALAGSGREAEGLCFLVVVFAARRHGWGWFQGTQVGGRRGARGNCERERGLASSGTVLRFEIHLTFSCCFLVLDLVFGGGGTPVDWLKVMVVGYWQYWALGVVLLYKIEFLNLFCVAQCFSWRIRFSKDTLVLATIRGINVKVGLDLRTGGFDSKSFVTMQSLEPSEVCHGISEPPCNNDLIPSICSQADWLAGQS